MNEQVSTNLPPSLQQQEQEPHAFENPTGLIRLNNIEQTREQVNRYASESLYSFSFASNAESSRHVVESRKSIIERSLTFLKTKLLGLGTLTSSSTQQPFSASPGSLSSHTRPPSKNYNNGNGKSALDSMPPPPIPQAAPNTRSNARPSISITTKNPVGGLLRSPYAQVSANITSNTRTANSDNAMSDGFGMYSQHSPSRFAPVAHATATTTLECNILTTNDTMLQMLGLSREEVIDKNILDFISPHKQQYVKKILAKREVDTPDLNSSRVLICGKLLPLEGKAGRTTIASLWLKERVSEKGNVYIWVFEQVRQTTLDLKITSNGAIVSAPEKMEELFGYPVNLFPSLSLGDLFPRLAFSESSLSSKPPTPTPQNSKQIDLALIDKLKFFIARAKNGFHFPVSLKLVNPLSDMTDERTLRIACIPHIAGMVVINGEGAIQSCNPVFTKNLFGMGWHNLNSEAKNISALVPQSLSILDFLENGKSNNQHSAKSSSTYSGILTSAFCKKIALVSPSSETTSTPSTPNSTHSHQRNATNQPPSLQLLQQAILANSALTPFASLNSPSSQVSSPNVADNTELIAIHRDGAPIFIDMQVKSIPIKSQSDVAAAGKMYALWISFDRQKAYARYLNSLSSASRLNSGKRVDSPSAHKFNINPPTPTFSPNKAEPSPKHTKVSSLSQPEKTSATTYGHESDNIDNYEILESLGEGAYGFVQLAHRKDDPKKEKVVMKYVVKSRILLDSWTRRPPGTGAGPVPIEIFILDRLRSHPHENVVHMINFFEDEMYFYIVMKLHGFGLDLFDYIELSSELATESDIKKIFQQTLLAVQHLHHLGICHRDIKDENVILDEDLNVQLIDFGSSAFVKPGQRFDTFCGTMDYAAPEVLTGNRYEGPPQDVWALGILLYTLIYRENPFYNIDEIINGDLRIPFVFSEDALDLIKRMLTRDLSQRPNIDECLQHKWFQT